MVSYFSPIADRTVFKQAQYRVFEIPKEVTWIAPMRHFSREKHCKDKVFALFLCVVSLSSVLG